MTRVYPIFTDGKKFIHSSDLKYSDNKSRTAYFSEYDLEDWRKIEEPTLTKEQAKKIFEKKLFRLLEELAENLEDEQLIDILKVVDDWVHAYDRCVSGDTDEETYEKERASAKLKLKEILTNGI